MLYDCIHTFHPPGRATIHKGQTIEPDEAMLATYGHNLKARGEDEPIAETSPVALPMGGFSVIIEPEEDESDV